VIHYVRDVDGSHFWQVAGRWGVLWSPRGRYRLLSERNGLAPSGWHDVRVGRTAELSFARLRGWPHGPSADTRMPNEARPERYFTHAQRTASDNASF
jgi:hypothetical protein